MMQCEGSVSHRVGTALCLTHIQRKQGPQSRQSHAAIKTNGSGLSVGTWHTWLSPPIEGLIPPSPPHKGVY